MRLLHIGFDNQEMSDALIRAFGDYKFMNWSAWTEVPGNLPKLHADTLSIATEFCPDVILLQVQKSDVYTGEFLSKLPGKIINWTWDVRVPTPEFFYDMGQSCISAFTNQYDVDNLRARGLRAEFLQSGFSSKIFCPTGPTSSYPEIVFIGNNYKNQNVEFDLTDYRINMVNFLRDKYNEKFQVYGLGWGNIIHQFMYKERKEAECYRSSKIGINASHYVLDRYTSDRMLRLMGSGTLCLTQAYPGIEKDFIDGTHLRVWSDFDELKKLIDYYLHPENEEERATIAAAGCEHVHHNYTWDHFANKCKELR